MMILSIDSTAGVSYVEEPSWVDLRSAIESMDEKTHTEIVLSFTDERQLMIGGGNDRYSICVSLKPDAFVVAYDPRLPNHDVSLMTGGQIGMFAADSVLPRAAALEAAAVFFQLGELSEKLHWRTD